MTHWVEYKGQTIYCNNGIYHASGNPSKKYLSCQEVKTEIDKVEEKENFVNLRDLTKTTRYER